MKSLTKKIGLAFLTFFALTGFILISGLVVLYSLGYRYDFSLWKPYKIGILSINTKPEGATVYLDGKAQGKKTPIDFRDLVPKEYTIKIEKEGFQDFEVKATITAGVVTRLESIFLINKVLAPIPLDISFSQISSSPNTNRIAFVSANAEKPGLWYYNTSDESQTKLFPLEKLLIQDEKITIISWSPSGKSLLIKDEAGESANYLLINVDNPSDQKIINSEAPSKIVWKDEEPYFLMPGQNLVYQTGDVIETLPNIKDAAYFQGSFYLLRPQEEFLVLEKRNDFKGSSEEIAQIKDLKTRIYPESTQFLMMLNGEGQLSWLKTENNNEISPIVSKASAAIIFEKNLVTWDSLSFSLFEHPFDEKIEIGKFAELKIKSMSFFNKYTLLNLENDEIKLRSLYYDQAYSLGKITEGKILGFREKTIYYTSDKQFFSLELQPK